MKSEIERLQQLQQQGQRILDALASNNHSAEILNQLRNGERLEDISRTLEISGSTSNSIEPHYDSSRCTMSLTPNIKTLSAHHSPQVFEDWHEQSPTTIKDSIHSARYHGQQAILGDQTDSQDPLSHHGPKHTNESWTTVTSDGALVEHLLALYFCWEYPIFATVSKEHFIEDFRKGYSRYCSSLLVNALLALACRFSDRPSTRRNMDDCTTAGDAFFVEAWRLFNAENDHHILTTVQALGVMSLREASCGRISESNFLSVQSIRLAIEMGLHVEVDGGDGTEKSVREATFWGAFSLNE
jgi:hypothetical protein